MIFCENCFIDSEIIARIKYNSEEDLNIPQQKGNCPICNSSDKVLYNTDSRVGLNNIFDPLFDLYSAIEELPPDFPEHEKKYLYDDLLKNWNIFNPALGKEKIKYIIQNISEEYYVKKPAIFSEKVGITGKIEADNLASHSLVKTKTWDDFVIALKTNNRFHTKSINEDVLSRYCSFLEKRYKKGQKFFRGRISKTNNGYGVLEMGAPSFEFAKAGRANAEGIRHLYLASDDKTTIHEVRAGAYDIISVGIFELQRDVVVVDFQRLDKIYPFAEGINLLEYAMNVEHFKKMNQEMSKTLRRDDSHLDYISTQFIADCIKSFQGENSEQLYRGIEYQSTMNKDGYNLVAFYPEDFICISVKTVFVTDIQYKYDIAQ